jgi:xylulokinase
VEPWNSGTVPLYLGFDASTQGLTAIVLEISAGARRIVFQHSLNFDRDLPEYGTTAGVRQGDEPGVVYSPPQMWADALDRVMGTLASAAEVDIENIRAISGSAQQHGSVYLNRSADAVLSQLDPAAPLAPQLGTIFARREAPVWLDASTTRECREIEAAMGGAEALQAITGSPAYERFTGPQIRKFHREQPDAYAATARIHLVSSFMGSLLLGAAGTLDPGDASGMNLMDLSSNSWSPAALEATAPDLLEKLPPIRASWESAGRLSSYWQKRYAFPPAAIVNWSGDNPGSLVGTGVIRPGILAVSLGTSDTVFACTPHPGPGPSHVFRSPTGEFMSLVCFRNGSLAREWMRFEHRLDWDAVAHLLDERPGNDGFVMLPWLESEITPHVPHAGVRRFAFDRHDAGRNVRGLIEGQMMAMANHAADVTADPIERIVATGGAATNRAILQVMSNVFGVDVYRLDVGNSAALGAALRAYHAERLAAGEPVSWKTVVSGFTEPKPGHRVSPNPKLVTLYKELRREYSILERLHKDRRAVC